MWACGSRPHAWPRGARRSVNGAAVRQRGQDRIGRTAGSTSALYRIRSSELNPEGDLGTTRGMRTRTWLVVGVSLALGGAAAGQPAPAKKAAPRAAKAKAVKV